MEQVLLDQIIALRAQLHACAEVSGREVVTKHTLLTFLREHTSLELHELAGGFYAAHREPEGTKPHSRAARGLRRSGNARGRRGAPVRSRRTCRGAVRRRADA
ncbi:MAG: hypothetical protein ACLR4W_11745 [Oscillospiraceae bacterium]